MLLHLAVLLVRIAGGVADADCDNRMSEPYGWDTDGSAAHERYGANQRLCWTISPGPDEHSRFALSFARFHTESGFDPLEIFDGPAASAPLLTTISGHYRRGVPPGAPNSVNAIAVNTSGQHGHGALLQFRSDATREYSGFVFAWTPLPLPTNGNCALDCALNMRGNGHCDDACMNGFCDWDLGDCLERFECSAGCEASDLGDGVCHPACLVPECNFDADDCECSNVIEESSGYRTEGTTIGSDYDNDAHVCWLLRPKADGVVNITLSFARFDTESYYDKLRVFDGARLGASELYPHGLSGTGRVPSVTSSGAEILLQFRADRWTTLSGFLFGWTSNTADGLKHDECSPQCTQQMASNDVCEPTCMNEACAWDGGACWASCTSESDSDKYLPTCYHMQLGNGECDPECMIPQCGYDHGDCTCDVVLSGRAGFRSVGLADGGYDATTRLCWLIRPEPAEATRSRRVTRIELTFERFHTEPTFDQVRIFDGPFPMRSELLSPDTGRPLGETEWDAQPYAETLSRMALSGDVDVRELPSMVARSHQAMLVTFSSDNSLSHFPGFLFG